MLAGMSTDYVVRLEQGPSSQPSIQLLGALARALRLTDDERDHLFHLAGHRPPPAEGVAQLARAGLHPHARPPPRRVGHGDLGPG
ncbi:MAG: hypothetical protein QOG20_4422 [Pseudonocardiales bacterium]|jgi:transcriptional regulator with XRE-family HTH domain|nr:hypothetical protein [Pseudonocardiales bacterium]